MDDQTTKRVALLVITLGSLLVPFMVSSVNLALPTIGSEFALNAVTLSWVATAYMLAASVFLLPFGRLADLLGRKRVFISGVTVFSFGSLLVATAPSATLLLLFRVLQGTGGAMLSGTGVAILTSVFPPGERGKVLGINVAAVYIGLSLGPFVGGFLTQQLGWRSIFLINVPLGAAIVGLTLWKLKADWAEARGESFDWIGAIIYGIGLVAIMYGFSILPATLGTGLILGGIASIVAFVAWEGRSASPLLNVALLKRNRVFAFSNLAALISYSATAGTGFLLSLYLQYIRQMTPQQAGLILMAQPVVQVIFSPVAGRLSDRIEPRVVASAGMFLTSIGLLAFSLLGEAATTGYIVAILCLLGFGFALFSSPNTNAVMSSVEKRFYGVASATLGTMRFIGQMLSLGIATLIFALIIGRVQITPAYYPRFLTSVQTAFGLFTALCLAGVVASLVRGRIREVGPTTMPATLNPMPDHAPDVRQS